MVVTELFSISHPRFIRMIATRMAMVPLAVAGLLVVASAVAAFFDIRWLIVALMTVMIVLPMLGAYLYFHYGLREEGFVNVFPHRLTFSRGLILAETYFPPAREPAPKEDRLKAADEKWERKWNSPAEDEQEEVETPDNEEQTPAEEERVRREYRFSVASPMRYSLGSDGVTITLEAPHRGILFIPYTAFASKEEVERMIETMN